MKQQKLLTAVYGSLKKGHGNHYFMEKAGGTLLGEAKIDASMYSYGAFPVIDINTGESVTCEVYEIQDIAPLDYLESYPRFYDRTQVETPYGQAWVYHIPEKDKKILETLPKVHSGIW